MRDLFADSQEYGLFEAAMERAIQGCADFNQRASVPYYLEKWRMIRSSDSLQAYIQLRAGDILLERQRWDWAAECYQAGLEIDPIPDNVRYLLILHLAFALLQSGSLAEAANYARSAIEIYPSQAGGHLVLGLARKSQGDYDQALRSFQTAASLPVHDPMWGSYFEVDETGSLQPPTTLQAVKADPLINLPEKRIPLDMKGFITPEGTMLFDQYLDSRGQFLEFLNGTLGYFVEVGYRAKVEERLALMRLLSISPREDAIYWLKRGSAMEGLQEFREAAEAYRKGAKIEHDDRKLNYFTRNNLGYSLVQLGEYIDAEQWCRKAIEIEWDQHNAHKNLGLALKGQGRYLEAAESLILSTKIWPHDRRAFDHLLEMLALDPDLGTAHPDLIEFVDTAAVVIENARLIERAVHSPPSKRPALPKHLWILVAAVQVRVDTGRAVFTPEEIRLRIGAEKQAWELVYTPLLREMSSGVSKEEDDKLKDYRRVFQMQSLTEIRFSEKGEQLAELVGVIIQGAREG